MGKKINTKDLVDKIEKLSKERISKEKVVSLNDFRKVTSKPQPAHLLVIEDDDSVRLALKRIFESEGFRVSTAQDGTQLSEVLDDSPLDLILLDVGLPWVNGYELCELMKDSKDLRHIPILFVSGLTSEDDIKKGFDAGADDYIKKPFDIDHIKKTVKTLLNLNS